MGPGIRLSIEKLKDNAVLSRTKGITLDAGLFSASEYQKEDRLSCLQGCVFIGFRITRLATDKPLIISSHSWDGRCLMSAFNRLKPVKRSVLDAIKATRD